MNKINMIELVYHNRGRWVRADSLKYVGGEQKKVKEDFIYLSYTLMIKMYKDKFGMTEIDKLCYVRPGKTLSDGVVILDNDDGINDMVDRVLENECKFSVHVYPFEDIVVNQPIIETQLHANIGSAAPDVRALEDEFVLDFINDLCEENIIEKSNMKGKVTSDVEVDSRSKNGSRNESENESGTESETESGTENESGNGSGSDVDSGSEKGESNTSDSDSESEINMDLICQSSREVKYDGDAGNPFFLLGMSFANAEEARVAIAKYSIAKSTPLRLNPNEKYRIRARCKATGCPFVLFMSQTGNNPGLVVKTFNSEHNCLKDAKNVLATARFLATEFMPIMNDNPTVTTKELMKIAELKLHLSVSKSTCKRAKRIVRTELEGSYIKEFGILGAYIDLIKKIDPNTTVELELNQEAMQVGRLVFKRLYICFEALKKGWKSGCRPIIGLDGCHLKGVVKGQLLVAVGKDGNEQMFPIAWAVIDKENTDNWKWFLEYLVKDLEINDRGQTITIISDMQKGLINAVANVLPLSEHRYRYCARHVLANWGKKWRSEELSKRFWFCSWSTYREEFDDNLKRLGAISKRAAEDFVVYNPQVFCKAFFSTRSKCDIVENNICESFNASIRNARFKPIVSMLDEISECAMARLASRKGAELKWSTNWSPNVIKVYEYNVYKANGCKLIFNGKDGYQIGEKDDRHVVKLNEGICTCRGWDMTGIPCKHAIVALKHAHIDPTSMISFWYTKAAYKATYAVSMEPMPGRKFLKVGSCESCEPPPTVRLTGRPRVKRIRSSYERSRRGKSFGSLGRKGVVIKCSICHVEGHNTVTCPQKDKDKGKRKINSGTSVDPKCKRKKRSVVGMGLYIDTHNGNSTLNPGMSSETIINQRCPIASQPLSFDPDPTTRFPIPCERKLRQEQEASTSALSSGTRRIAFAATGTQVILAANLPFKPPGPTWNGKPCTTRGALEKTRREMKKGKK